MKKILAVLCGLALSSACLLAQTYSVLHRFLPDGVDGVTPSTLTLSGGVLYGVTKAGGTNGNGTLFKIGTDGKNYQIIQDFGASDVTSGVNPAGSPLVDGNTIYGVTQQGAVSAMLGTIYAIKTDGSNYRVLQSLTDYINGSHPSGGLLLCSNQLLGTTRHGGGLDDLSKYPGFGAGVHGGTMFALNPDGSNFGVLGRFSRLGDNPLVSPMFDLTYVPSANGDQIVGICMEYGDLLSELSELFLYVNNGDEHNMDTIDIGSIFSMSAAGGSPSRLFKFTADTGRPSGPLLLDTNSGANIAYGATEKGVYRFNLDSQQFAFIHTFTNDFDPNNYAAGSSYLLGVTPVGKLAKINDKIYGVCKAGGGQVMVNLNVINGLGVAFEVNTNGDDFRVLHRFAGFNDGAVPLGGLVADGHNLYGTTASYGSADANITGNGTIFKLDLDPPPLVIDVVPVLQYTNVLMIFTNVMGYPTNVVVCSNQIIAVTNTMGSTRVYYFTNYVCSTNMVINYTTNINVYTNHVSLGFATNPAALWRLDDGMSHQLLQSTTLFGGGTNAWIPLLPNWTNAVDTNQIGTIIKVNPNIPQAFFKLQSTLLGP